MSFSTFALMFIAMMLVPLGDAAGKLLTSAGVLPVFVAWSRFALGAAMIAPVVGLSGLRLLGDWRIWLRGGLLAGGITSIQTALKYAPLGDVFAAFFVGPLISYVLAGWLLREPLTKLRSVMICLGFVGVLLVVKPGGSMSIGLLFAVLAGLFYGAFLTASRWLADRAGPGALALSQMVIGALLLAPVGIASIPPLSLGEFGLVLVSAASSMLGNLILIHTYRSVPASKVAPLIYLQLLGAVVLGFMLFGDLPDALAWAGMAIILITGIVAARAR